MNFIPGPPSSSRKCHYPSIHCGQRLESHTSLLLSPQRFQPLRHRALSTLSPETSLISSSPLPHSYHSLGSQAAKLKNGPKTLTETSPKIYRWQVSTRKDAPCHLSVGKCKLKQQGETITYLAEWPKSGTLATPKAGEDVEQWERSFIASENAWYTHFGKKLGDFLYNLTYSYHTTQQSCSLVSTRRSWKLTSTQKTCTRMFTIGCLFRTAKT